MDTADQEKKKKYLQACLNERHNFTPIVASVEVLLWVAGEATLECLAIHLTANLKEPYSRTCGYMKSRVAITLASSTNRCIWVVRDPASQISVTCTQWEDGAGLHLFR